MLDVYLQASEEERRSHSFWRRPSSPLLIDASLLACTQFPEFGERKNKIQILKKCLLNWTTSKTGRTTPPHLTTR